MTAVCPVCSASSARQCGFPTESADGCLGAVTFVTVSDFAAQEEHDAKPLAHDQNGDTQIPSGGLLLIYGNGGAGKTTLILDLAAHLAGGQPWLGGIVKPVETVRVAWIENEGPRQEFRKKITAKAQAFPALGGALILGDPWGRLDLRDERQQRQLAEAITTHEIDLLVAGPVATLGMLGGGTPDDIRQFLLCIDAVRDSTERVFTVALIHHENKSGGVSGAWAGVPDLTLHVTALSNGRTKVHWEKSRWSSATHGTTTNLVWTDGKSFAIEHEKEARDLRAEIAAAFTADDGWRIAEEVAKLVNANKDRCKEVLSDLVSDGVMKYEEGPQGRRPNAKCWRLETGSDALSRYEPVTPSEGSEALPARPAPPVRGAGRRSRLSRPEGTGSDAPSHQDSNVDFDALLDQHWGKP